ncbi:uncharacterized protein LOC113214642 [Frankliniella occidentalis]|uniref:Uncharacterized protein LOC113214642 n=1 Tax=Frankliniella occidentalis TaxID=133901 RepID=A0A6J1TGC0_FRAOC|nr:uncharacterized protein LOC113214642 [Frankliniella occidentalis]
MAFSDHTWMGGEQEIIRWSPDSQRFCGSNYIGMILSLQNLPPVKSSQFSSIYLLALAFSEDIKTTGGFEKILVPFLAELRKLESETGVLIDISIGEPFALRATLTVLCADTLAAHEVLGLLSPSARHFCRVCMVSRQEFRANLLAVGERRTKAMLDEQVRLMNQRRSRQTEFGVRKSCPLHLSRGFDGTRDVIFDCFHDLLEGVCHWVVSLCLRSFISVDNNISLKDLNDRIPAFNYGVNEIKNKASANFSDDSLKGSKLKQTGCQMWCLTRMLGFLVPEVPAEDEHLKLLNLLQAILLIVFSDAVRPEDITRLEELIAEHHTLFERLHVTPEHNVFDDLSDDEEEAEENPDDPMDDEEAASVQRSRVPKKVTPGNKLHHLVHYPDIFRDHGSLIRYWCARYEGRHQIFCKYGSICCNFINIIKSMAQMYQLSTLSDHLKTTYIAEEMELLGPQEITVELSRHRQYLIECGLAPDDIVSDVEAVSIAGETYRPSLFVIVDCATPTFAIIQYIYVKGSEVYLVLRPWRTVAFERRYCAYRVEATNESSVFIQSHQDLARHGTFAPWNPWKQRTTYIAPRTILF